MTGLDYLICDPTGNITVLVKTPVSPEVQPISAREIMQREPKAEQVGFLSDSESADIALRMAGGEFCGNATMSAAAAFAEGTGIRQGEARRVSVKVSGAEKPIFVEISCSGGGEYSGRVEMPSPTAVKRISLPLEGGSAELLAAFMPGITHVLFRGSLSREAAEGAVKRWCALLNAPALGLMLLNEAEGTLSPLVYVPGADTLFWESSCASGTTAVGACLAAERGEAAFLSLRQPGGTLKIDARPAVGEGFRLLLSGSVKLAQAVRHLEFQV